jgi:hypothetical protein
MADLDFLKQIRGLLELTVLDNSVFLLSEFLGTLLAMYLRVKAIINVTD